MLPTSPRHGTVLPVTAAEYERLLRAYAPNLLIESVDSVNALTEAGDAPTLPTTVTVAPMAPAVPSASPGTPSTQLISKAGAFTVSGTLDTTATLTDGTAATATATVTVEATEVLWLAGKSPRGRQRPSARTQSRRDRRRRDQPHRAPRRTGAPISTRLAPTSSRHPEPGSPLGPAPGGTSPQPRPTRSPT